MPSTPSVRFSNQVLQPQGDPRSAVTDVFRLPGLADYPAGTVLGLVTPPASPRNEVHAVTIPAAANGGSVRLLYGAELTAAVAWNGDPAVEAAALQAALEALDSFAAGDVVVVGAEDGGGVQTLTITYQGLLGLRAIPAPAVVSSLTGGAVATVARTTTGHSGPGLAAAYSDAAADGTQTAKALLLRRTRTDLAGRVLDERPGAAERYAAAAYTGGRFRCSELPGLDAAAVADLGRLVNATAHTQAGAELYVG